MTIVLGHGRTTARPVRRSGSPSALRWLPTAGMLLVFAVWGVWFRPHLLGGPAGYVIVSGSSMQPVLDGGDIVVVRRAAGYRPGDVIAYRIPRGQPGVGALVIHRIIGGSSSEGFQTQGDNRDSPDVWRPAPGDVAGRVWLHGPGVGRVLAVLARPLVLAGIAFWVALLAVLAAAPEPVPKIPPTRTRRRRRRVSLPLEPGRAVLVPRRPQLATARFAIAAGRPHAMASPYQSRNGPRQ